MTTQQWQAPTRNELTAMGALAQALGVLQHDSDTESRIAYAVEIIKNALDSIHWRDQ
jgi:hypothetical protein